MRYVIDTDNEYIRKNNTTVFSVVPWMTSSDMAAATVPNLYEVPILALRLGTSTLISRLLNPHKVLPTDDGLPRDWRGLAHLTNLQSTFERSVASNADPTKEVLKLWSDGTLGLLQDYLGLLDRYDIIDDTKHMIEEDAIVYTKAVEIVSPVPILDEEMDKDILTVDDIRRLKDGLPPQHYSAYILYAEQDEEFALKIIEEMEMKYKLKLCCRDRDLVAGHVFEHEAIMKLISERCNRLLVLISPNFLRSEASKFFFTFAQALGIEQRRRKVIPVMYQRCPLPPELNYYFVLDYTRTGNLWNFWDKLYDSIQTTSVQNRERVSSATSAKLSNTSSEKSVMETSQEHKVTELFEKPHKEYMESMDSVHEKPTKVLPEEVELRKSASLSLENLKTKSKKWFSGRLSLPKKKKSKKAEAVLSC